VTEKQRLVVVGNGMVGHQFLAALAERSPADRWTVTVFAEEPRLAYDRVHLSSLFAGKTPADLAMGQIEEYRAAGYDVRVGERVVQVDREARVVVTAGGESVPWDRLVLATGSSPFVPNVPGKDLEGVLVYRTIEDLEAIRARASEAQVGVVIGGGLLGLEAAGALRNLGLETHVVELAQRLMCLQVDDAGGRVLSRRIQELGIGVHTGKQTRELLADGPRVGGLAFADGGVLPCDMVVFSAGIRPRDELARAAGLEIGPRGGVVIDDHGRTSDPDVFAIGECASHRGRVYGLVAPGYRMAEAALLALEGAPGAGFAGADGSTKLKLLGVDVASFGDAFADEGGVRTVSLTSDTRGVYRKLVVSADGARLVGGVLVGDASDYDTLLSLARSRAALSGDPEALLGRAAGTGAAAHGPAALPDEAIICSCHNVTKGAIVAATRDGAETVSAIKKCTKAGTGCGSCVTQMGEIMLVELRARGAAPVNHLCEHFPHSRQELFHLVRVRGHKSFDALIAEHGRGAGCEICKPAVASILASVWNEYVLEKAHLPLQDTNDRFLANMQRDGTYSVVPRVAGGEITPRQLIALGEVAERYHLYTKITGGQRVDLFGARRDELPAIWRDLIAAGFESGHAYGKALRTVKSCVGSTWCRYGVQDSVGLAIRLENRYKGLRAPHKIKGGVSGCARECAEAQGKDFGLIATDRGYNLYVCGNGGMRPAHAKLLAQDLTEDQAIQYLDRFLMFYVRTAGRLERTATWLDKLDGGMDYLRRVVVDDSLGIAAELEADMARIVETYRCEWRVTLEDPARLAGFRSFVNSDTPDPSVTRVTVRGQLLPEPRPARNAEAQ